MAMTFVRTDKAVPTASLRYWLHNHLNIQQPARSNDPVHASSLTKPEGFCPRYYALLDTTQAKEWPEFLDTSMNVTFAIGRWMQDWIVHQFADMGKAVCDWECVSCGNITYVGKRPLVCETPDCHCKSFKPIEMRFISKVTGASCGVDMLVELGSGKLRPVEIKTIAPEPYKALVAPLAEHRLRTNLYLRIIEESEVEGVDTDLALVLYISKGGYGCLAPDLAPMGIKERFSPFKEFIIKRNDNDTEAPSARAKVVKDFRAGEVGMPRGICPTALTKRACVCSLKDVCFSGDYPPVYDWKDTL
jgi:hypothetical protein